MVAVRYTPTRMVIESTIIPRLEHSFIKYPGRQAVDVTDLQKSTSNCAIQDNKALFGALIRGKQHTFIHTHTCSDAGRPVMYTMPSAEDLKAFIMINDVKTMVIASRHHQSGVVLGFFVARKTVRTPKFTLSTDIILKSSTNVVPGWFKLFVFNRQYRKLVYDTANHALIIDRMTSEWSNPSIESFFVNMLKFLKDYKLQWKYLQVRPDGFSSRYVSILRKLEKDLIFR